MDFADLRRLDSSHHLLLGDQVIDPLQQPQQTLHTPTPLIQDIVRIPWLREAHDPGRAVDLRIHRLGGDQFADVFLRLVFLEIEKLCEPGHLDPRVVFRNHPNIVFNDPLSEILPSLGCFLVTRLMWLGVEDIGAAKMWSELLRYHRPPHDFVDGEEFEKLGFKSDLGVARFFLDAVEEIGLFVVVWCEDDVEDDSL